MSLFTLQDNDCVGQIIVWLVSWLIVCMFHHHVPPSYTNLGLLAKEGVHAGGAQDHHGCLGPRLNAFIKLVKTQDPQVVQDRPSTRETRELTDLIVNAT